MKARRGSVRVGLRAFAALGPLRSPKTGGRGDMRTWLYVGDDEALAGHLGTMLAGWGACEARGGTSPDVVLLTPPRDAPAGAVMAARVLFPAAMIVIVSALVFDGLSCADAVVPPWALDRLGTVIG